MAAIKEKVQDALNEQIKWELYSSYLYLSMSAYFTSINLSGFAHWMKVQAQEEVAHAMRFYDYVIERGGRVKLLAIDQPQFEWEAPLQTMEEVYEHEKRVTGLINGLMDLAVSEKDYPTINMLQWFVEEQVEEESSADAIVQKVKMVSGDRGAGVLYMLDKELGQLPPKFLEVVSPVEEA